MKKLLAYFLLSIVFPLALFGQQLMPQPQKIEFSPGKFRLAKTGKLLVEGTNDYSTIKAADRAAKRFKKLSGEPLGGKVRIHSLVKKGNEEYHLRISQDGIYIVSPSLPKWWDGSWDELCHSDYKDKEFGYATTKPAVDNAYTQSITSLNFRQTKEIKFGCGMHTLYSKSFWELVGIPESFGGYGPEDTYGMAAATLAIRMGYDIKQFVIDGVYITEDYTNRTPSFDGKIVPIDKKKEFYDKANALGQQEVINFAKRLIEKQSNL